MSGGFATPPCALEPCRCGRGCTGETISQQLDRAYYHGARQAQSIAHQSLIALDEWIADGCGNRVPALKAKVGQEEFPSTGPVGNTSPVDTATGGKPVGGDDM